MKKSNVFRFAGSVVLLVGMCGGGVNAAVLSDVVTIIHDETIDGDAPPLAPTGALPTLEAVPTTPNMNLGTLPSGGRFGILGSVEGSTVDNVDIFEFSISTMWTVDLVQYDSGTGNDASSFRLHDAVALTLAGPLSGKSMTSPADNIFDGFNTPGTYRISVFESGSTTPATYQLVVNTQPVPEPSVGLLLCGALGVLARRRRGSGPLRARR